MQGTAPGPLARGCPRVMVDAAPLSSRTQIRTQGVPGAGRSDETQETNWTAGRPTTCSSRHLPLPLRHRPGYS